MKKNILRLGSVILLMLTTGSLVAEEQVIADWTNITVRGGHKDKKVQRLNPGTYKFTLTVGVKKGNKVKLIINQKNAVVGKKRLHMSKYGEGTHNGEFVVQARRLESASGSASGEYHNSPEGTGGSAAGSFEDEMTNVNATREVTFILKNPIGKKRIKYGLKIYQVTPQSSRQIQVGEIERNTDRMGSDYKNLTNLRDASVCQRKCKEESLCVAWTFVKPHTIQGPQSQCYLKNSIPQQTRNNACESGIISR